MIKDSLDLNTIVLGLENALKIEYKEKDIEKIKQLSKQRIEAAYGTRIVGSIYETQISNRLIGDNLSTLMANVVEGLKQLALLFTVSLFDRNVGMTIADVNYLGYAKDNMLSALKFLQDEVLYESRDNFFPQITSSINHIEMSVIKRLLTVMVVMEDLGIKEGVSLIAQYLYLGGL